MKLFLSLISLFFMSSTYGQLLTYTYSSPSGFYSINFPEEPKEMGDESSSTKLIGVESDSHVFMSAHTPLGTDQFTKQEKITIYQEAAQGAAQNGNGTIITSDSIHIQGHLGMGYIIEYDDEGQFFQFNLQMVIIKNHFYRTIVGHNPFNNSLSPQVIKDFQNSFAIDSVLFSDNLTQLMSATKMKYDWQSEYKRFKLTISFNNSERTQLIYITKVTDTFLNEEQIMVWSPVMISSEPFSQEISNKALDFNRTTKIGYFVITPTDSSKMLRMVAYYPIASATPDFLKKIIFEVGGWADNLEEEFFVEDDF